MSVSCHHVCVHVLCEEWSGSSSMYFNTHVLLSLTFAVALVLSAVTMLECCLYRERRR